MNAEGPLFLCNLMEERRAADGEHIRALFSELKDQL